MNNSASRQRQAVNCAISLGLAFGLFWPFHFAVNSPFWERLMDAVHVPLFFGVSWWLDWTWPRGGESTKWRLVKIGLATVALAAVVEWIQPFTGRTESLVDFCNGVAGTVAGCSGLFLRTGKPRLWHGAYAGFLVLLSGFALLPAWQEWEGIHWRQQHFPLLGDFEDPAELKLWTAQGGSSNSISEVHFSANHTTHGSQALQVVTGRGSWAGVSYAAGDKDWSGAAKLVADFYNPGEEFVLGVRVDDDGDCRRMGQRFDREWRVVPGASRLEISMVELESGPSGRKLNLRAIRRLVFFTGAEQPARTFFLDHVRIE